MKFSIIIPIYNVEKYLRKCIDSIIKQTYKDFEIILIDDGSTDKSRIICDEYDEEFDFVTVVHKANEGQGAAWMKEGLSIVKGDYVGSIDSDDWVAPDLLERISIEVDNSQPDILVYGYKNVSNQSEHINVIRARKGYYTREDIKTEILPNLINTGGFQNRNCLYLSRVNKFIKRDLLIKNNLYYDSRYPFGEDNFWTIPNVLSANSLYVFSDWYPYSYRINPTSTIHSYHEGLWEKFCGLAQAEISILNAFDSDWMCNQIYNDMVLHAAISINNIIRGGQKGKTAINEIKSIVENSDLREGLKAVKRKNCSLNEWINVNLMRMKAVKVIYFIKKLQFALR